MLARIKKTSKNFLNRIIHVEIVFIFSPPLMLKQLRLQSKHQYIHNCLLIDSRGLSVVR